MTDKDCEHPIQTIRGGYAFSVDVDRQRGAMVECEIVKCRTCGRELFGFDLGNEANPNFVADPYLVSPAEYMHQNGLRRLLPPQRENLKRHQDPQHDPGE